MTTNFATLLYIAIAATAFFVLDGTQNLSLATSDIHQNESKECNDKSSQSLNNRASGIKKVKALNENKTVQTILGALFYAGVLILFTYFIVILNEMKIDENSQDKPNNER